MSQILSLGKNKWVKELPRYVFKLNFIYTPLYEKSKTYFTHIHKQYKAVTQRACCGCLVFVGQVPNAWAEGSYVTFTSDQNSANLIILVCHTQLSIARASNTKPWVIYAFR